MARISELTQIEHSNLILVEGPDDDNFFRALARHLEIDNLQVINIEGKDNLRSVLGAIINMRDFPMVTSLIVVRDADSDPQAVLQSVSSALAAHDLPVPHRPLTFAEGRPQTAFIILPDADSTGELEDLCLRAIADDPALPCVDQYFECLMQSGFQLPAAMSKARIQVFLASKNRARLRVGEAAQAGFWPFESDAFEEVKTCLRQLAE
jgi:hypothetical protein